MNYHNLLDLLESETNLPGQRTRRSHHHSLPAWGVMSRLAAQAVEQADQPGAGAEPADTLLISDPRRCPGFYKPHRDRLGALVGKTPTPRGAEIEVRVR